MIAANKIPEKLTSATYSVELAFTNTITIEDDPCGLEPGGSIKLQQQLLHHRGQVLDDFLAMFLDSNSGGITTRVGIHTTYNLNRVNKDMCIW